MLVRPEFLNAADWMKRNAVEGSVMPVSEEQFSNIEADIYSN